MYYQCSNCGLIFVDPQCWVNVSEEVRRYDLHDNTATNTGYVNYLKNVVDVVNGLDYQNDYSILDFGCGKNAVLSTLLSDTGCHVESYDPLYGMLLPKNNTNYQIVILCEVIEHLRNLSGELNLIKELLIQRGKVIIRTQLYESAEKLSTWWYAQDKTHINFFSEKTIEEVGKKIGKTVKKTVFHDIFILE